MRITCIFIAAVLTFTLASAAYADCGCSKCSQHKSCGCTQKHEGCGCAKHGNKCGGDVQLLPDAPQCNEDLPQCCDRQQYTMCCEQAHFEILCQDDCKCKVKKCDTGCGCNKCAKKACNKCGKKGCGRCQRKSSGCDVCD
jgi:hypothetical protein